MTQEKVVTSMFRDWYHCADAQVWETRDSHWDAQGCGMLRHYECRMIDSFVEAKLMCWEIPDKPSPFRLVQEMHGRTYGCNATDVRPLEGSPRIYQALGCGRRTFYECWTDANQLFCKRTPDEPMFIALVQGLHGRTYGCNATDVRPLEGSPNIYQARGCDRSMLYECWAEASQAFCKPR
jgi:hypothetical protein